jgi:hypothetical protein
MKAKEFVREAFDYNTTLDNVASHLFTNPYLLELIAYGFVKYGETVEDFTKNSKKWLNFASGIFKEIGYDKETHQVYGVINYVDFVVVIDEAIIRSLKYVIDVQKKYGLIVKYKYGNETITTTLSKFFETIQRSYPQIKDRYKGLGSSDPAVVAEVVMNPKTRRIYRVTIDDIERTKERMSVLIGKDRDCAKQRKEMLLVFKFTVADIDT